MSSRKFVAVPLLQGALALALVLAVASQQCTTNSLFLEGRVTECAVPQGSNRCQYGVCWGEQLKGYSGLTVELADELGFSCTAPGLTIWLLSSRQEYDACTATEEGSVMLKVCEREGDEFVMYLVSSNPQDIAQDNFVRLQSHRREVYFASLSSDGTSSEACTNGAKMIIGVNQTVPGGVSTDPASSGPPTDTTGTEDTPRTGEISDNSGKGVLACSLVAVLAAAVLPLLSLLC